MDSSRLRIAPCITPHVVYDGADLLLPFSIVNWPWKDRWRITDIIDSGSWRPACSLPHRIAWPTRSYAPLTLRSEMPTVRTRSRYIAICSGAISPVFVSTKEENGI